MNNVELRTRITQRKSCGDCLHCKVYAWSTENCRLCFCTEIGKKAVILEHYWLKKSVCRKFEDMSA